VCGRTPEDGEHAACIEIYEASMNASEDGAPPAAAHLALETMERPIPPRGERARPALERVRAEPVTRHPLKVPIR